MAINQFKLLCTRRFLPLFITQFLGAFNDNLYKNALVVLITYLLVEQLAIPSAILVTLTGCLLILPMFIFSASAGSVADKFEKAKLIRIVKLVEIVLMTIGAFAFILQNITLLMIVLLCLGVQATYFGPVKYSILPAALPVEELIAGTGLIEMGTFLAILLGNILGVILIVLPHGLTIIAAMIIAMAVLGYVSSLFIPTAGASAPQLKLSFNFFKQTVEIVNFSRKSTDIFLSILGISWFWLIGFVFLTESTNYAKDFVHGNQDVFVLFLAIFSIGVGVGSSLCNRILKGQIEATFVPLAALGMSIFTFDLYYVTVYEEIALQPHGLYTILEFIRYPQHWRIMIDMLLIAICGGIFVVPLYTILQHRSEKTHKARIIASNNILNALFMSVAAILTMLLLKYNFTIPQIFLTIGLVNLIVVVQSCRLLPGALVKSILRTLLTLFYNVEVKGLDNFHQAGTKVVITPNHTSFLDAILLAAFLPGKLTYAINHTYLQKWWIKPITLSVKLFGLDPTNPFVIKALVKYVKEQNKLVIFPEGRITVTGALMKIYEGPGLIAEKAEASILPVLIEGAQYTPFSRLRGKVKLRWFPKITLTIFKPELISVDPNITGRRRRQIMSEKLYNIMSNIMFLGNNIDVTLFQSLLDTKTIYGKHHKVIEDVKREPLSYQRLIIASILIGKKLAKLSKVGDPIGILLPNVMGAVITFFGLQAYKRVSAMINFSTGSLNVLLACQTAQIKLVCTSRVFIETAKLNTMIEMLIQNGINIIYLEDIKAGINSLDKLHAASAALFPKIFGLHPNKEQAQKPAVILFTSGSEGTPKAVVLSSRNIQSNRAQLSSRVDFNPSDIVLNALPLFHSFGLTAGTLLPILYGLKVFLYPSPLHYRMIPELAYDINASILFGTNTFLAGYARYANPYDFYSIRYVYAGAEKLKEENRRVWADRFGVRIFEGYGATETSPVISANTPMHNKPGSVGKLMPGINYTLHPVPDMTEGSRLSVEGPNIMLGYMFHNNPGVIVPPLNGWYDTGDIVSIDNEGYITLLGRAKRFAKIGGEMISLTFVENFLDNLWPDAMHAVVTLPDEKKGEKLVLLTTQEQATLSTIIQYAKENGISELTIPKVIHIIAKIPLLGSGKVDYGSVLEYIKSLS